MWRVTDGPIEHCKSELHVPLTPGPSVAAATEGRDTLNSSPRPFGGEGVPI